MVTVILAQLDTIVQKVQVRQHLVLQVNMELKRDLKPLHSVRIVPQTPIRTWLGKMHANHVDHPHHQPLERLGAHVLVLTGLFQKKKKKS